VEVHGILAGHGRRRCHEARRKVDYNPGMRVIFVLGLTLAACSHYRFATSDTPSDEAIVGAVKTLGYANLAVKPDEIRVDAHHQPPRAYESSCLLGLMSTWKNDLVIRRDGAQIIVQFDSVHCEFIYRQPKCSAIAEIDRASRRELRAFGRGLKRQLRLP